MRLVVQSKKWFFNIPITHIVREEDVIFAYFGKGLVAMFDMGSIDAFWISDMGKMGCEKKED